MKGRGGRMVNAYTDQISIRELGSVVLGVDVQSAVMSHVTKIFVSVHSILVDHFPA